MSNSNKKPVLVDSLLCFLHNFRQEPQLQAVVLRHFSPATLHNSLRLLCAIDNGLQQFGTLTGAEELLQVLLQHLDRLEASEEAPIFAASDLLNLPFRLLTSNEDGGVQVGEELRQIRFLLQDWLLQQRRDLSSSPLHSSLLSPVGCLIPSPIVCPTSSPESPPPPKPLLPVTPPPTASDSPTNGFQSPAKGHRISQVLQKLTNKGKEDMEDNRGIEQQTQQFQVQPHPMMAPMAAVAAATFNPALALQMQYIFRQFAFGNLQRQQQQQNELVMKAQQQPEDREASLERSHANDEDVPMDEERAAEGRQIADQNLELTSGEPNTPNPVGNGTSGRRLTMSASPGFQSDDGGTSSGRDTANSRMADTSEEGTEEKPYSCPWSNCSKRFANKFLLKKHQFIHSGQKPHICQFCKKPFNRKDNLLRHKKTHLQNGTMPVEGRRRHNMLRGITHEMALELQLLPLSSREARQQQRGANRRSASSEVAQQQAAQNLDQFNNNGNSNMET